MSDAETVIKNVIPAGNITELRKIAILNSIGKKFVSASRVYGVTPTATDGGTVTTQLQYQRYLYFVLSVYMASGARSPELQAYMNVLHYIDGIGNDGILAQYIQQVIRRRREEVEVRRREEEIKKVLDALKGKGSPRSSSPVDSRDDEPSDDISLLGGKVSPKKRSCSVIESIFEFFH